MVGGLYASSIEHWWDDVKPLVQKALGRGMGEWELEDIRENLLIGEMQAWVAEDEGKPVAVLITQIVNYPRKKFCDLVLGAGTRLDEWKDSLTMIAMWAKYNKCSALRIYGRRGWLKALNMEERYTVMTMEI